MSIVSIYALALRKIENSVEKFLPALSGEQLEKAKEYKIAGDYYRSVAGAYLVNKFTSDSPVYYGKNGKPYKSGVFYNLSHSGDFAVLAVAKSEVGIDIEKIREIGEDLIAKVCSPSEKEFISGEKDFFKVWTLKESLLKCVGSGLISRLNEVPSIPEGLKDYLGEKYCSKSFSLEDHVVSVTVKTEEEFDIELKIL